MDDNASDENTPDPTLGGMTPKEWRTKYGSSTNKQKADTIQMLLDQAKALRGHTPLTAGQTFGAPLAALGDIAQAFAARHIQDKALEQKEALLGDERDAASSLDQYKLRQLSPDVQANADQAAALRFEPDAGVVSAAPGDVAGMANGDQAVGPAAAPELSPKDQLLQAIAKLQSQPPPGGG